MLVEKCGVCHLATGNESFIVQHVGTSSNVLLFR